MAVNNFLLDNSISELVQSIMKKLRSPLRREALRDHTELSLLVSNLTRWSSTYEMLKRYVEIRNELPLLKWEEPDEILSNRKEYTILDSVLDPLPNWRVLRSTYREMKPRFLMSALYLKL